MTRKLVSLVLALILLCSVCSFAAAEDQYAEHFDISIGVSIALPDDAWANNYFNKMIEEKFNVTFVPYSSSAGFEEVTNLWIATGDMPDWITAGNGLAGLMDYADQGLLAGLPEGWQERYPALAKEIGATEMEKYCTIDGTWYVIPRIVFSPNFPLEFANNPTDHSVSYYRTDWVDEQIPEMITIADLKPIVENVIAEKAAAGEKVYGVTGDKNKLVIMFIRSEVPYYNSIYPINGEYVLGAAQEGVIEGIKNMKEWYEAGLIDPDFYGRKVADCRNIFYTNGAFIVINDGSPDHANVLGKGLLEANPDMGEAPAMNVYNILSENGEDFVFKYASVFWRTLVFSPNLEKEPAKFERILAIMDYLAQPETVCSLHLGEKGINWDYDENGRTYVITPYEYSEKTGANMLYDLSPSSQDAYAYGFNPSDADWAKDMGISQMTNKNKYLSTDKLPTKSGITTYDRWVSDAKTAFGAIGWQDEIIRIVLAGDVDVETEWNNFIEANKGLWQPLLDEMNASLK